MWLKWKQDAQTSRKFDKQKQQQDFLILSRFWIDSLAWEKLKTPQEEKAGRVSWYNCIIY